MNPTKALLYTLIVVSTWDWFALAHAAPIAVIDQQNPALVSSFFTNFDIVGDGVRQEFTPTLARIDALDLHRVKTTGTSVVLDNAGVD
jgi:hypothetical protein